MPVPTKAQFQSATNLWRLGGGPPREADPILRQIDQLLDRYQAAPLQGPQRIHCLGRLFVAADLWLKEAAVTANSVVVARAALDVATAGMRNPAPSAFSSLPPQAQHLLPVAGALVEHANAGVGRAEIHSRTDINRRRLPAVQAFWKSVVDELIQQTGVAANVLPQWLEETFGVSIGNVRLAEDLRLNVQFYSPAQLDQYRLRFRDGLCYVQEWWKKSKLEVPASTSAYRDPDNNGANTLAGFAGFVVTISGTFYSTWHRWYGNIVRFHSSYFQGDPVLCSGEIRIENGFVEDIYNKSGHYMPGPDRLRDAVEMLAFLGVDIDRLRAWSVAEANATPRDERLTGRQYLARVAPGGGSVARNDWGRGNGRATAMATLAEFTGKVNEACAVFREHWKPAERLTRVGGVLQPPHGPALAVLQDCPTCSALHAYWDVYRIAALRVSDPQGAQLTQVEIQALFNLIRIQELFRDHWRAPNLGHGAANGALERCAQCSKFREFWPLFLDAIQRSPAGLASAEFSFADIQRAQLAAQAVEQAAAHAAAAAQQALNLAWMVVAGNDSVFVFPMRAAALDNDLSHPAESVQESAQRYAALYRTLDARFAQELAAAAPANRRLRFVDRQSDANLYLKPFVDLNGATRGRAQDVEGHMIPRWVPVLGVGLEIAASGASEEVQGDPALLEAQLYEPANFATLAARIAPVARAAIDRLLAMVAQRG